MSSNVSFRKHRVILYSCFIVFFGALFVLSCVGLGFGAYNYATYQSTTVSTTCNLTSCVSYEGTCSSFACFYQTWDFELTVNGVTYNATYTVTSEYNPGQCSFNETIRMPVIACYYDSTNIEETLTLEQPYDDTFGNDQALMIVSIVGVVFNLAIVIASIIIVVREYRLYRIALSHSLELCSRE